MSRSSQFPPILTPESEAYPDRLRDLDQPPDLHVRQPRRADEVASILTAPTVAIVGARRATEAACSFTGRLSHDLAAVGVVVVSGLALGVDAAAHEGCLRGNGVTVAVLGCGIDVDYPAANRQLAGRVAVEGLVVSEYEHGVPPAPWRFPARNRIVAALADVVCVVEASRRSGALITAGYALALGRDVLVAPSSPWHGAAQGGNELLRDGASPLIDAGDVLAMLGMDPAIRRSADPQLPDDERLVLACVRRAPATIVGLQRSVGLPIARIAAAVAGLELADLVRRERDGSITG